MLEVRNLSVSYGPVQALAGISLEVREGEIVALIGANGAGKSSLIHAVAGLAPAEDPAAEAERLGCDHLWQAGGVQPLAAADGGEG